MTGASRISTAWGSSPSCLALSTYPSRSCLFDRFKCSGKIESTIVEPLTLPIGPNVGRAVDLLAIDKVSQTFAVFAVFPSNPRGFRSLVLESEAFGEPNLANLIARSKLESVTFRATDWGGGGRQAAGAFAFLVPEPNTALLLGLGLSALAYLAPSRRNHLIRGGAKGIA